MDAVPQVELGQHVLDVGLHGALAERELPRDLRVGVALYDLMEYVELAGSQLRQPVGRRVRRCHWSVPFRGRRRKGGGQEKGVSGGHHADRGAEMVGAGLLEQQAACAFVLRPVEALLRGVGQDQHGGDRRAEAAGQGLHQLGGLGPFRHAVHKDDVRAEGPGLADGARDVGGLAYDCQVRDIPE